MLNNFFKDKRINYKDFLLILSSWYFILFSNYFLKEREFAALLYIGEFFSFILTTLGYMLFLFLAYLYFQILYDFSLKDLGFKFNFKKLNLKALLAGLILLTVGVILININAAQINIQNFKPLYIINDLSLIIRALPVLAAVFLAAFFQAAALQFLFNKIVFSLFDLYLPSIIASLFTGLFAPILVLQFEPGFILIVFISVIISNYFYQESDYNLLGAVVFYASFLTLYISFIYGFNFLIF
ncbi:MAG: hypothetical protein D5S01_09460 [Halanaerobium sp. MSAO_Bac5]|nr:MAG: hypothetical protein D5S01_09460 [Halanaerobium sp. MSAO_Bac5]